MYSYFLSLILLSSISFGGHFARSSLSIFGLYMINDSFITPGGFGILLGACALPSMLVPLIVGHAVDKSSQESRVTLALFFSETFGYTLLAVAVTCRSYVLALVAVMLFGMGTSSLSVIQRVLVTIYLKESVSFTTGFYVAMANISKMLGKMFVGPVAVILGSYQVTMFFPAIACIYSLAMYWIFHLGHAARGDELPSDAGDTPRDIAAEHQRDLELAVLELEESPLPLQTLEHMHLIGSSHSAPPGYHSFPPAETETDPLISTSFPNSASPEPNQWLSKRWLPASARVLPEAFFWLAGVHTLYILIFHSFVNFMPHLVYTAYHVSQQEAGYIACMPFVVTIFIAPPVGYLVDCVGRRVMFCAIAAVLTVVAYSVVIYTNANPYIKMALVAIPHGFVPVLTLAEITSILPPGSAGIAFGMIEVLDSIVNVLGSVVFGQLYNATGGYDVGMVLLLALAWIGMILLIYMSLKGIPAPVCE